jgi:membrane protein DedA with SNARE-associated domain
MQGVQDWLSALPPAALYVVMFLAAAIENVFPPIPADTVVAFGSFLAARGEGTIFGAFAATLLGNMTGAAAMYAAGRKYGAERIERRLLKDKAGAGESRLRELYERYGLFALFMSRFLPVIRAIVPPFAGALRLPFVRSIVVMGSASGIWYGLIAYLAFRVGANWTRLQSEIAHYGKIMTVAAVAMVLVGVAIWLVRRRGTSADTTGKAGE